jgi:NitT/TauT family transport system substrate-binding protein
MPSDKIFNNSSQIINRRYSGKKLVEGCGCGGWAAFYSTEYALQKVVFLFRGIGPMTGRSNTLIWICLALLLTIVGPGKAGGADQPHYRIGTVAWMGWSPLHVAQARDYWKRQGLSVEVINYDDPLIVLQAIKSRHIDLAMDMAGSVVGLYQQGVDVLILAETNWSHGGDKILIHPGREIKMEVAKPLGVFLNLPSCLFFLGQYLKQHNLKISDFRIVEMGPDDLAAQFVAGRIPVMVNYEPWVTQAQHASGARILASSADYLGCIPECLWGYREHVREIPDAHLEAIIRGWVEAAVWVNDPQNWEQFTSILNSRTFAGHASFSRQDLAAMFRNVRIHDREQLYLRNRNLGGFSDYLSDLKVFMKENRLLEKDFEPGELFDNRFVIRVLHN